MYFKFWVLIFTTVLSMSLYSSNKKMTVVIESSSTGNFDNVDSRVLVKKAFEELVKSKFIKKIKKEKKGSRIKFKFGKIQNRTDKYDSVSMVKSFLSVKILNEDMFSLLVNNFTNKILEQERRKQLEKSGENDVKEADDESKPDFIITGSITSKKEVLSPRSEKFTFIFNFRLVDAKTQKIAYENNVVSEKIRKIRKKVKAAPEVFNVENKNAPKWVNRKAGIYTIDGKRAFVAVGVSQNLKTRVETVEESIKDAKKNLFYTIMPNMKNVYMSYKKLIGKDNISDKQINKNMAKLVHVMTSSRLSDSEVKGRWTDSKDKNIYTLLVINFDKINGFVKKSNGFDEFFIKDFKKNLFKIK